MIRDKANVTIVNQLRRQLEDITEEKERIKDKEIKKV